MDPEESIPGTTDSIDGRLIEETFAIDFVAVPAILGTDLIEKTTEEDTIHDVRKATRLRQMLAMDSNSSSNNIIK